MTMRSAEPGYIELAMHDPSERRGLWARVLLRSPACEASIEVCAGREGDDAYFKLEVGMVVTAGDLQCLADVVSYARYSYELGHPAKAECECFGFDTGYMGNSEHWCYWPKDYPDEGSCGPFETKETAMAHAAEGHECDE